MFQLAQVKGEFGGTSTGIILLALSLAFDGLTGPVQEGVLDRVQPTRLEFMGLTNLWALVYLLPSLLMSSEALEGVGKVTSQQPRKHHMTRQSTAFAALFYHAYTIAAQPIHVPIPTARHADTILSVI